MIQSIIDMYSSGAITTNDLIIECLHRIDPEDPAPVLGPLPDQILMRIRDFARSYRPDGFVMNHGSLPAIDQVQAAVRWIESDRKLVVSRAEPGPAHT